MLRDDLNEPLVGRPAPPDRSALRRATVWAVRLASAGGVAALAAIYLTRPTVSPVAATIPYEAVTTQTAPVATPAPTPSPELSAVAAVHKDDKAPLPGRAAPRIIDVAEALASHMAPAPDRRLAEPSKYGTLPRVGADGARAGEVYARPFAPSAAMRSAPRIAVFVGGVGLDAETTRAAISRLPGAVSLGVAPYGAELAHIAESARAQGHEIWLQAPMEGSGALNPGPHTLKTGASAAENVDDLHWLMGRFPGYVGVAGYLGGKFTADVGAFSPILAEIGRRGLDYFDDASSPLGKASELSGGLDVKASRADVVVDGPAEAAFVRAEELARRRGSAILVATALAPTMEALAHWMQTLEAKGFVLAPVSALTNAPRDRDGGATP